MKKLQLVFLFVLLVGCSSSPNAFPAETSDPAPTQMLAPTQTAIPPTETLTPTSTFTPPPTATWIGGGGGKIAFISERDGYAEIYVMDADGSEQIALANGITPKYDAAWSPDGRKIAFASNNDDSASLYIMNASGSHPTKLIDAKDLSMNSQATPDWQLGISRPVWSPDGKKIAFSASHKIGGSLIFFNIYVINADGSNLVSPADHAALDSGPAWSPDSQKIAFNSGVEWDKVGFVSNSCGGSGGICVMNADGTKPINLTNYGAGWDANPIWSPDGDNIAFNSYRDGNYEIYVMKADGSNLINLTNNLTDEGGAAWSPDSTRIAFVSGRDGNSEIYVIDSDGSNLTRLTNNDANDYSPVWSP